MKKILVVCMANYCENPVAEKLLQDINKNKFKILSAGIEPLSTASMDPRSIKYLKEKNFSDFFLIQPILMNLKYKNVI